MDDMDMRWAIGRFEVLVAKYSQIQQPLPDVKIKAFWSSVSHYDKGLYGFAIDSLMYSWTRTVNGVENGVPIPPTVQDVVVKCRALVAARERHEEATRRDEEYRLRMERETRPDGLVLHTAPDGEDLGPREIAVNKRTMELVESGVEPLKAFITAARERL